MLGLAVEAEGPVGGCGVHREDGPRGIARLAALEIHLSPPLARGVARDRPGQADVAAVDQLGLRHSQGGRARNRVRGDRWKLIRSLQSFYYNDAFSRQTGTTELYDLGADPGEADNVVASHAEVAAALGDGLDAWVAARHADGVAVARPAPIPRERLEQLRALGYVE